MNDEIKKTILLVEDEVITALMQLKHLEKKGYNVIHVLSGEKAIDLVCEKKSEIHLILMDIDLGCGMDGSEVAEIILNRKDIPVIFLSSHTESEIVERTEKITSYGYVVKNTGITVLDASIKMAFRLFQEKQKVREHQQELSMAYEELEASYEQMEQTNQDLEESQLEILIREEKLWESVAQKDTILQTAMDGFWLVDLQGKFVDINDAACSMIGYTKEEMLNMSIQDIEKAETPEDTVKHIESIMIKGFDRFETKHQCKDGSIIDVEVSTTLIPSQNHFFAFLRNVTELKRIEKMRYLERERMMSILNAIPDGIYIVNEQCDIEYINPVIEQEFGSINGRKCYNYFHERSEICPWCKNDVVYAGKSVQWEWYSLKNDRYYNLFDMPFINADGSISKFEIFHDITDYKHAEEKILFLLDEKDILLKEVHHRIKNNMNVIRGLICLQSESLNVPEAVEVLQDTIGRIDSMNILYDKLYKSEGYKDVSIDEYLFQLIDEIWKIFPYRNTIHIEKNIEKFYIDSKILSPIGIILNELLSNTMKYAFKDIDNGLIKISVTKIENNVTLIFEDNGIGIPELNKIEKKGFGLELIDMLIKQIEGSYEIEREKGTRFIIKFDI